MRPEEVSRPSRCLDDTDRLVQNVDESVGRQQKVKADIDKGQGLLFGASAPSAPATGDSKIKPLSEHDTLAYEREVLGFYFSGHPLLSVKAQLRATATHEVSQLTPAITTPVRLAGMISKMRKMVSKKTGEPWVIVTVEDLTGEITTVHKAPKKKDRLATKKHKGHKRRQNRERDRRQDIRQRRRSGCIF